MRYDDELGADFEFCDADYRYEAQIQVPDDDQDTEFELELLTRDANHLLEEFAASGAADMDAADCWCSCIQSAVSTRWSPGGVKPSVVLAHAERVGGPVGAVLAASVAVYGPSDVRSKARRRVRRIRESHRDLPHWIDALGEVAPVRAVRLSDRWREHSAVIIDYERRDGSMHGLSVAVHPFCLGLAQMFSLGPPSTSLDVADHPGVALLHDTTNPNRHPPAQRDDDRPVPASEEISLADARAIIEAGLRVHNEADASIEDFEDFDDLGCDGDIDMRALLEQRIELLPVGGRARERPIPDADKIAGHIGEFVSQPYRLGEHRDEMGDLMHTLLGFAMNCHDRDIVRWTPPRVASFLEDWIPEHGIYCEVCGESHEHPPDEEWLTTVESAFPRWLRFAAERSALGVDGLEENLAAARESLKQMRRHATGSALRLS